MRSLNHCRIYGISCMKIRHKVLFVNLVGLLIPCILFALVSISYLENQQIGSEIEKVDNELNEAYTQFMNAHEIGMMALQSMLLNTPIERFIENILDPEVTVDVHEIINFNNTEVRAIERLVNTNPYIYSIRFYINYDILEFEPMLYRSKRFNKDVIGNDTSAVSWYFNTKDTITSFQKVAVYPEPLAAVVVPYTNIKREKIGYIEVTLPMRILFPMMYEPDEDSCFYFIDKDGWFYRNPYDEAGRWDGYQGLFRERMTDERTEVLALADGDVIVGYRYIKSMDSYLLKITSLQNVRVQIARLRTLVIVGLLLLIGVISWLINKSIGLVFTNFYKILDAIKGIQKGDLDVQLDDFGNGEMGELGRNIQTMAHNIKRLMAEQVNKETLVKDAEIKALQNQINAHFIYNVLESIKMMAEIEGMFDISDAITHLGKLLRYTMKWRTPRVKISEEVDYIKNYMALLNLRYSYAINVDIDFPERLWEQEIPKMCIQPIVENAMKHGVEEVAEDTTLYLRGKLFDDHFTIEVTDFGTGMSKEQVDQLRQKIKGELVEEKQSSTGIGLKNVQERIQLCFGEDYGIEVISQEGSFTKIIIKIPYSK